MRFTVHIMQGASVEATLNLTSRDDESPEELAARGRGELMAQAMRVREARSRQIMTESTLRQFVDIYGQVVLEQARTGGRRFVTAYTAGGEEVFQSEGQIALFGRNTDVNCLIEVVDDATLKRAGFVETAERELGRPLRASDVTFEDVTDADMDRSFDR